MKLYVQFDADKNFVTCYASFEVLMEALKADPIPEGHNIEVMTDAKNPCPGCSGESDHSEDGHHYVCQDCGGRHGKVTYAYYRTIVKGDFYEGDLPDGRSEYFDFIVVDPPGKMRRFHGWRDKVTGKLLQVG
jgi:hypothetical protein